MSGDSLFDEVATLVADNNHFLDFVKHLLFRFQTSQTGNGFNLFLALFHHNIHSFLHSRQSGSRSAECFILVYTTSIKPKTVITMYPAIMHLYHNHLRAQPLHLDLLCSLVQEPLSIIFYRDPTHEFFLYLLVDDVYLHMH